MFAFILRRVLQSLAVLAAMSAIVFAGIYAVGNPVEILVSPNATEIEKAETIKTFYDEYFAVMDLPAEFYIDTIRDVFQEHLLPQGKLTYKGRTVNPGSIRKMGLMTVEGEKDDICSIGQTLAAQDLCIGVRAYRKVHHMQAGVGHYGVFSGRKWNSEIYPLLRDFIHVNS